MRAWILLAGLFIAIAIRPELNKPSVMGKAEFFLIISFFFGGLFMDILEFVRHQSKKTP